LIIRRAAVSSRAPAALQSLFSAILNRETTRGWDTAFSRRLLAYRAAAYASTDQAAHFMVSERNLDSHGMHSFQGFQLNSMGV
ncbi:hypothetical protein PHET_00297, partial [Paragonimus heterotremus]